MLPRLRKFLFHPDVMTRRVMISLLAVLGCLEMEPVSDEAGRDQLANSPTNVSRVAAKAALAVAGSCRVCRPGEGP